MKTVKLNDAAHWHALRAKTIGSSEVAALFGVGQFMTPYDLWHTKKGNLDAPNLDDVVRVLCGRIMEPAIAEVLGKVYSAKIREADQYYETDWGAGCTPDFEIFDEKTGQWVPLEIKNIDFLIWRDHWVHEGDDHEPPEQIALQVQHQMLVMERPAAYIGVLVGGNDPYLIRQEAHPTIMSMIKDKVIAFWQSIEDGNEPDPTAADVASWSVVNALNDGSTLDLRDDDEVAYLIADYQAGADMVREGEARKDRAKIALAQRAGDAETVLSAAGKITLKTTPAKDARVVEYAAQPQKRVVRVYPKKEDK